MKPTGAYHRFVNYLNQAEVSDASNEFVNGNTGHNDQIFAMFTEDTVDLAEKYRYLSVASKTVQFRHLFIFDHSHREVGEVLLTSTENFI